MSKWIWKTPWCLQYLDSYSFPKAQEQNTELLKHHHRMQRQTGHLILRNMVITWIYIWSQISSNCQFSEMLTRLMHQKTALSSLTSVEAEIVRTSQVANAVNESVSKWRLQAIPLRTRWSYISMLPEWPKEQGEQWISWIPRVRSTWYEASIIKRVRKEARVLYCLKFFTLFLVLWTATMLPLGRQHLMDQF